MDISVSGIPSKDVSPEWDSFHNDACLIATKEPSSLKEQHVAKFTYERRYNEALDLRLRYDFMYQWIITANRREILRDFLSSRNIKTVYIYGYEKLGKLLYDELSGIDGITIHVIREEETNILEENTIVIISLLDSNRHLKFYLDKIWANISKFYLDDIFTIYRLKEFLSTTNTIYIYGTGSNGEDLSRCLMQFGYQINGFIVSDGKRTAPSCKHIKIFELGELQNDKNIGIIVAVTEVYRAEIITTLENAGYHNFEVIKNAPL